MEIYASGKNIPTYPFGNLFTQGEIYADEITFYIDRYYSGIDLYTCNFAIRGLTEQNSECSQNLNAELAENNRLKLVWRVADVFTYDSGKLLLEIRAIYVQDAQPHIVVKYSMPPVYVKPTFSGNNSPLPDTTEQAINEIISATADGISEIQEIIDAFDIDSVSQRLDQMEADTAVYLARPEVIPVTQAQYDSTEHKQNALYVIVRGN